MTRATTPTHAELLEERERLQAARAKGGRARAASMTRAQRKKAAKKAARKRWPKPRPARKPRKQRKK